MGSINPRVDWSFHDEQENDAINTPQIHQDSYDMNASIVALETTDSRWKVCCLSEILRMKSISLPALSSFQTSAAYVEQVYGRPFEWSLSVKYNFFWLVKDKAFYNKFLKERNEPNITRLAGLTGVMIIRLSYIKIIISSGIGGLA